MRDSSSYSFMCSSPWPDWQVRADSVPSSPNPRWSGINSWSSIVETKLFDFQHYYNGHRTHAGLDARVPESGVSGPTSIDLDSYRWRSHCRGLYQTPMAA